MPSVTRGVKIRVELDGEKEYKDALAQLNAGNRTLQAEMKLLKTQYKDNADSMEFLTEKGDLLERMLDQQQKKTAEVRKMVEAASKAYEEAAQAYADASGEDAEAQAAAAKALQDADKKLQGYMANLYNAETAELELTQAIDENNEALENDGQKMVSLGDALDQLGDKLGIRIPEEAKNALNGIEGFSAGTVAKMALAAGAVVAVTKVLKELGDLTLEVAGQVDEYITESAITGVSTQMLQAWDYAAPLIDTDAETIKGAMTKITQAMGNASAGNEETIAKFQELGVSITDDVTGGLRSAEDVFYDVIDALGRMDAGAERDAAAMALLGKSAQELNPLINAGSKALNGFAEEAEAVGYILSEDQVAALGAVDDAYQGLQLTVDALKKQIAADFAPAAESAMKLFSDAVKTAGEWLERSGLIQNLGSIIQSLVDILRTAGEMVAGLPGFTSALNGLKVVFGAIAQFVAVIADAADLLKSIVTRDFSGVKNALGFGYGSGNANNYQRTVMQQNGAYQEYQDFYSSSQWSGFTPDASQYGYDSGSGRYYDLQTGNFVSFNAGGTDWWRGGLTWVGEAGPELVSLPRGSQILSSQESQGVGGDTYYITIDAASVKEFSDIVEIAQSARMRGRMR